MRIMVVGSSSEVGWDLVWHLRSEGHGVVSVPEGRLAMEILRAAPPAHFDLLVVSLGLPAALESDIDALDLAATSLLEGLSGRCVAVGKVAPALVVEGLRLLGVSVVQDPSRVEEILRTSAPRR